MSSQLHRPDLKRGAQPRTIAHLPEGFFERLGSVFDFRTIHQRCALPYNPVPESAKDNPGILFKILLLEYLIDVNKQEVEQLLLASRELRQFLNVNEKDSVPPPEVVALYRERLGWIGFRRLYDQLLEELEDKLSPVDMAVLEKRDQTQSPTPLAAHPRPAEGPGVTLSSSRIKIVDPWAEPEEERKRVQSKPPSTIETERPTGISMPASKPPTLEKPENAKPVISNLSPAQAGPERRHDQETPLASLSESIAGEKKMQTFEVPSFLKGYEEPVSNQKFEPGNSIERGEILRPIADLKSTSGKNDSTTVPPLPAEGWMIAEMRITERRGDSKKRPPEPTFVDRSETDPLGIEAELDAAVTLSLASTAKPTEETPIRVNDETLHGDPDKVDAMDTVPQDSKPYLDFSSLASEMADSDASAEDSSPAPGVSEEVRITEESSVHSTMPDSQLKPPTSSEKLTPAPMRETSDQMESAETALENESNLQGQEEWQTLPTSSDEIETAEAGIPFSSKAAVKHEKPIFSSLPSMTSSTTNLSKETFTKVLYLAIPILVLLAVFLFILYLKNSQSTRTAPGVEAPSAALIVPVHGRSTATKPPDRSLGQRTLASNGSSRRATMKEEAGMAGKTANRANPQRSTNPDDAGKKQALLLKIRQKYQLDLSPNQYTYQELKDISGRPELELKKTPLQ